jgi:Lysozyme inhibitor LprI
MARSREIIEQIADARRRLRAGRASAELPIRLQSIEHAFSTLNRENKELIRYFPVALVACMEGYFRITIKEVVDVGEPYLSNAERLIASLKLDFTFVKALHGKSVTVGELVGHNIPLSRLDHIEAAMTTLLDSSLIEGLRAFRSRWEVETRGAASGPILSEPDQIFADVARTFELRHIISHELASAHEVKYDEVAQCLNSCVSFLQAVDEFISDTLQPNAPLTQSAMNESAGISLTNARTLLNEVLNQFRSRLHSEELEAFDSSQSTWEHYCATWADFDAMQAAGGTLWPALRSLSEAALVNKRMQELRDFQRIEDGALGGT